MVGTLTRKAYAIHEDCVSVIWAFLSVQVVLELNATRLQGNNLTYKRTTCYLMFLSLQQILLFVQRFLFDKGWPGQSTEEDNGHSPLLQLISHNMEDLREYVYEENLWGSGNLVCILGSPMVQCRSSPKYGNDSILKGMFVIWLTFLIDDFGDASGLDNNWSKSMYGYFLQEWRR